MTVTIRHPNISLKLIKAVQRKVISKDKATLAPGERFTGAKQEVDLTPFIGESGSVRTSKSVREMAGAFSITLADRMDEALQDSLIGLIEPMDVIEIRFAAKHHPGLAGGLPIIMRGIVSSVRRVMAAGGDRPVRQVMISGHDHGKLPQIFQIHYSTNYVIGSVLINEFKLWTNYGIKAEPNMSASKFVETTVSVVNKMIDKINEAGGTTKSPIKKFSTDLTVSSGNVAAFGIQAWEGGTLASMLYSFGDVGPWNEMYVEDREDKDGGVTLVYRHVPFKTPDGAYTQPVSKPPSAVKINSADIRSMSLERTDANVANFYWVDMPRGMVIDRSAFQLNEAVMQPGDYYLADYPNSAVYLYGFRKMQVETQQLPSEATSDGSSQSAEVYDKSQGWYMDWLRNRRDILMKNNKDVVIFESGSISLAGNESIKAGMYLQREDGLGEEYYVTRVDHSFVPFGNFTTDVAVERGTGFIKRIQRGSGKESPYMAESAPMMGGTYD